jgi:hypothetical protein
LAGAAFDSPGTGLARPERGFGLELALFGFQHKRALAIKVQLFQFTGAIAAGNIDLALKGGGVFFIDGFGRVWRRQIQNRAQFREKERGIGLFRAAGSLPAGYEVVDFLHLSFIPDKIPQYERSTLSILYGFPDKFIPFCLRFKNFSRLREKTVSSGYFFEKKGIFHIEPLNGPER